MGDKTAIVPVEDNILVQITQIQGMGEGPCAGVVLACGPGKYRHGVFVPMIVEVGDAVLFEKPYSLKRLEGDRALIDAHDILAKLKLVEDDSVDEPAAS